MGGMAVDTRCTGSRTTVAVAVHTATWMCMSDGVRSAKTSQYAKSTATTHQKWKDTSRSATNY